MVSFAKNEDTSVALSQMALSDPHVLAQLLVKRLTTERAGKS